MLYEVITNIKKRTGSLFKIEKGTIMKSIHPVIETIGPRTDNPADGTLIKQRNNFV